MITGEGVGSEVASLSALIETLADRGVASSKRASVADLAGKFVDCIRGDEVVRNSRCDEWVDSGGRESKFLK